MCKVNLPACVESVIATEECICGKKNFIARSGDMCAYNNIIPVCLDKTQTYKTYWPCVCGNKIAEKIFRDATAVLPICKYLEDVVKEHYPNQNTGIFFEGVDSEIWYHTKKIELEHPAVGLVQDANWWGKTKEMLVLENVLKSMPDVHFYWAGDGQYKEKILKIKIN